LVRGAAAIFALGLRLPLHARGHLARVATLILVGAAFGLVLLGNIALYDVHVDATVSGRFTPPPELETVAESLQRDVILTHFYNSRDEYADAAKQVLAVPARRHPHLRVCSLDLDTELTAARDYGVKVYNTVVVEAEGRRTQVENKVDLRQMAYAIERVLQRRTQTVCFGTGQREHNPGVEIGQIAHRLPSRAGFGGGGSFLANGRAASAVPIRPALAVYGISAAIMALGSYWYVVRTVLTA
jgi:hypothetical protein